MPIIQFKKTCPIHQVEGFPAELPVDRADPEQPRAGSEEPKADSERPKTRPFQRSCDGAIYASPGSTKTVTKDELEFMKKDPLVGDHLCLLFEDENKLIVPAAPAPLLHPPSEGGEKQSGEQSQPSGHSTAVGTQTPNLRGARRGTNAGAAGDR